MVESLAALLILAAAIAIFDLGTRTCISLRRITFHYALARNRGFGVVPALWQSFKWSF